MNRTAIALSIAAALAAAAPAAQASTVTVDGGGTLVVTAGPERNRLGVQASPLEDGRMVIYDGVPGTVVTSATPACEPWGGDEAVICTWSTSAGVRVELGGGDDDGYASSGLPASAPFAFDGGEGSDDLRADVQPTTLSGGPGDDHLDGSKAGDHIQGGDGNDEVFGDAGADRIDGGGGDDRLSGDDIADPAADVIEGGPGTDTIDHDWSDPTYFAEQKPVFVTLAGGGDDGRPGEGDDVHGVEKIITYQESRLVGTDAAEHLEVFQILEGAELIGNGGADTLRGADGPDTIDGGAGPDEIDAGFGDDTVTGGPGQDAIFGDRAGGDCGPVWCKLPYGNDTIDARDGERDSVNCGVGQDAVKADAADVVAADCETVDRGPAGSGPTGAGNNARGGALAASIGRAKLAAALARGLRVRVTAPTAGTFAAAARTKGKPVATGSRKARKAGPTTITLEFTKKAKRQLRRASKAKLTVVVRFKPKSGAAMSQKLSVTLKRGR